MLGDVILKDPAFSIHTDPIDFFIDRHLAHLPAAKRPEIRTGASVLTNSRIKLSVAENDSILTFKICKEAKNRFSRAHD